MPFGESLLLVILRKSLSSSSVSYSHLNKFAVFKPASVGEQCCTSNSSDISYPLINIASLRLVAANQNLFLKRPPCRRSEDIYGFHQLVAANYIHYIPLFPFVKHFLKKFFRVFQSVSRGQALRFTLTLGIRNYFQ